jgi:leucyl aminopeptidase
MHISFSSAPVEAFECDTLIVLGFEKTKDGPLPESASALNRQTDGWVEEVYGSGEFCGKPFESVVLHRPAGTKAKRLLLAGAGKQDKVSAGELARATGAALRTARKAGARNVALLMQNASAAQAQAIGEGALLGNWEPSRYRTKDETKPIDGFTLLSPGGSEAELAPALERGRMIGEGANFARDLATEPPNVLGPQELAERARAMAAEQGLECEVLDRDRMREIGMGSLLGVAQGSVRPPALIILRYRPANAPATGDHLGLVGKGVTFDTGGISIKPADNMDKMKYDMSGGAAMIGAMRAIAGLKPAIPVTGYIPTVENMPGGNAQRPGDIVKSLSGKTIEVLNTDAEGRLILNDTITYARSQGCTHLVDAATLTGACVVALGHVYTGVFSNNEAFQDKFLAAAKAAGEKMWPLPLDEEYRELLKSPFADLANIGGRWGGAITAAYFLKEFAEDTPWIHLDIAGTASYDDGKPFAAKGASGIPVRTLVELALTW